MAHLAVRHGALAVNAGQRGGLGVPQESGEPDYRMSLAVERTYLAWVRTSLALMAGGVAVVGALPDAGQLGLRRVLGVLLVVTGLCTGAAARGRRTAMDAAVRAGRPLPRGIGGDVLAVGVLLAAVLALVVVLRV